jgi:DNA invertase Pin-like site-specific DNA recombinase
MCSVRGVYRYARRVSATLSGDARCSTAKQDLTGERVALLGLCVAEDRTYLDEGLTGTARAGPGSAQVLTAVRAGEILVMVKLDRLARTVPDACGLIDSLVARGVRPSLGGTIYDRTNPMGKMFFNISATFAKLEVALLRMLTREGMAVARAKGLPLGEQPKLSARRQARLSGLHAAGEHSVADLAELFSVSWPTVYRVLERVGGRPAAGSGAEGRQHRG